MEEQKIEEKKGKKGIISIATAIGIFVGIMVLGFGGYKAVNHFQATGLIKQAEELEATEDYDKAINLLWKAKVKAFTKGLEEKIDKGLEKDKQLIQDKSIYNQGAEEFDNSDWQKAIDLFAKVSLGSPFYQNAQSKIKKANEEIEKIKKAEEEAQKAEEEKGIKEAEEKAKKEVEMAYQAKLKEEQEAKRKEEEIHGIITETDPQEKYSISSLTQNQNSTVEHLFNNNATIISHEESVFLGEITNKYDIESVLNKYGNYGSKYSPNSIFNKYGNYGGKYSIISPFNKYSLNPPEIYIGNTFWGYLSRNKYLSGSTLDPNDLLLFAYLKYNDDSYLELMITD